MAVLLYGSSLRLMEPSKRGRREIDAAPLGVSTRGVRINVCGCGFKDIDFGYGQITVRDSKGRRERVTILPERLRAPLQMDLARVR